MPLLLHACTLHSTTYTATSAPSSPHFRDPRRATLFLPHSAVEVAARAADVFFKRSLRDLLADPAAADRALCLATLELRKQNNQTPLTLGMSSLCGFGSGMRCGTGRSRSRRRTGVGRAGEQLGRTACLYPQARQRRGKPDRQGQRSTRFAFWLGAMVMGKSKALLNAVCFLSCVFIMRVG